MPYYGPMPELVFEVVQEADGGYCAECLTENIFTEGFLATFQVGISPMCCAGATFSPTRLSPNP
jgi:hypothetical protein